MQPDKARDCARALVQDGYLIVPYEVHQISHGLIAEANVAAQNLIDWLITLNINSKSLTREGEGEPDVLLIHRKAAEQKDIKYFLHVAHDILDFIRDHHSLRYVFSFNPERKIQLEIMLKLYHRVNTMVGAIINELWKEYGLIIKKGVDLNRDFRTTFTQSIPYNTTTLRGLLYPACENHKGARMHPDKDFITASFGGEGGQLLGHRTLDGQNPFPISPNQGEIALFFGIKALLVSDGLFRPLYHSATAEVGKDRRALVQFCHINYHLIDNAFNAFKMFCESKGFPDSDAWYAQQWAAEVAS